MTYVYRPYPKALTPPGGGRQIVVPDEAAHKAQLAEWGIGEEADTRAREAMLVEAEALGVKVDRRWSDKTLAQAIEAAK